ncbi:seryl-tRNA synthetase [Corchorus capsularis]|uniref:Seryl-tRNA synthetase n=1 Tax=Corchorus capsularis TaxID=210143 RepID=A0A1R3IX50_COCAP|nr:seryl-tRNA synthetase [Corchorus capsularis]
MVRKLHQVHVWMRMARRFGITTPNRAGPVFRSRVMVTTGQFPSTYQQVFDDANLTPFQGNSSYISIVSNPLEGSSVEIGGQEEEKFQDLEEQEDGLDLRLKL